ncbi:hypothetical protein [Pseudomonas sp. AOB-7]|uniref:hypothetical protein n=1 Tax=Pseudomonas sp. AOB-7 TaxID=2482750 RepID=UPI0011C39464|nr:hypothetical protein [Pseudomonas sp. AOB-7]
MKNVSPEESALFNKCQALAQALRWQRKPFDAKEIDELTEDFYRTAKLYAPYKSGDTAAGLRSVYGAVDLLLQNICGPNNENPSEWFLISIQTLINIIEPTSIIESEEGLEFLLELESGIARLRTGEQA